VKYETYSNVPAVSASFVPEPRPPPPERRVPEWGTATAKMVSDLGGTIGVVAADVGQAIGSLATTAWEKGREFSSSLLEMMNWDGTKT
jgi:hypothetical protein